ncbi:ATP-binding cassette domain-containing protein [Chloroflexota bacterium]
MATLAIEANGLQKQYENVTAVRGVDLQVGRGEIFGLVGADGAGKTTTIRMLCTLLLPSAGEAKILGMDTVQQAGEIKKKIGYMSEQFNLYPTLTVAENLDFFAGLRGLSREVAAKRKKELLSFCRMEPFQGRYAEHLSGGMQKKLALACSLIHEPEVIFLDEPTTGVDPVSRRDFWRIIAGFLTRGVTVFVSTPYLDEAERFNRMALMYQGQIIACDTPQHLKDELDGELLEVRAHPARIAVAALKETAFANTTQVFGDTIHVMVAKAAESHAEIKTLLERKNIEVMDIRTLTPGLEDVFVTRLSGLEEKPVRLEVGHNAENNSFTTGAKEGTITVAGLTRKFGDFTAVDRVEFEVQAGEIFGLLGPNGSGKTTTIRMITGLLEPTAGKAQVMGYDMSSDADKAQSRIGYMSQKFSLFTDLTVAENISFYGTLYGLSPSELEERKQWVLKMAGLRGKEGVLTQELSGGWRQRLALGCTIMHNPEVIFLDEPTAGVDPLSRRSFWELIQELAARGTTIFITTHYMDEAEHCHRLGLMYQGKLIALGSPQALKTEIEGELLEVVSPDYARIMEILTSEARYRHLSLFGSNIHVVVDDARKAITGIQNLLEAGGIMAASINPVPFSMEDIFISLIEARELSQANQG